MEIVLMPTALADLAFWKKSHNEYMLKRIRAIIESIQVDPFDGIGKPERLKHNWEGWSSRRISHEHRIVYKVTEDILYIYSLRFHY